MLKDSRIRWKYSLGKVHLLCYFADLDHVLDFQQKIYKGIKGKNNPVFFGEQVIMDEKDRVTGYNDRLLIGSVGLSVERIVSLVIELGGRVVPAHVDKKAYSIISNLGFIPPDLDIKSVEVSRPEDMASLLPVQPVERVQGNTFLRRPPA